MVHSYTAINIGGGHGCSITVADQLTPEFEAHRQRFAAELDGLLGRFESEVPKFSPRYFAYMFSELSLPAMVGYITTLLHNPNKPAPWPPGLRPAR